MNKKNSAKQSSNIRDMVVPRGIAPLRYHAGAGKRNTIAFAFSARSIP